MKTVLQLREELKALSDKFASVAEKAKAEDRELTAEEQAEVEKLIGTDGKGGEIASAKAAISRAEALEAAAADRAALQGATNAVAPSINVKPAFNMPADSFYRTGSLKSFKGENAEKHAYMSGRYALATVFGHEPSRKWCEQNGLTSKYLNTTHVEGANELGGHLVFPEMERAIIDLREQFGVFRQNARVVPMGSDTKRMPRRTGGLTAYFTTETGSMTESNKTWDAVELVAKKMYVLCKYSNEISEDAIISIGDDLVSEGAYAMAVKEDNCGFLGDGTSTYGGIVGLENAIAAGATVTATGQTTFSALTFGTFEAALGVLPTYVRNPKWYISKIGYYASMRRLLDAAGGNSMSDLAGGAPANFMGLPVVFSTVLPDDLSGTTATTACYVGDLGMSTMLGDRRGITVKRTDDRYFETDEIGIRLTSRFDINVHERGTASLPGPLLKIKFG